MSDYHGMTPAEARRYLQERMETEGAVLAYETAVSICRDPKASATAKASALKALFYVAGHDGKPAPDRDKPVSEMTYAEAEVMLAELKREHAAKSSDTATDIFD
ncbi:hypothetical protein ASG51_00925 [Methylobacterium sp. Leaf465]|uniref:hypothetical protein n=1 Tax=Methylobacterium sp. Leaf465 TaxID=1736385 RepID=UPI000701B362|nr:hypothetical protein [Methylobacterium sp. Leaf465]KQT84688.1 hypothetical protein ASG51_00925 [Methylobacterium sp. Leaf465]